MSVRIADDLGDGWWAVREQRYRPGQMKFVTYNIHYGFGRDGVNDLDRISAEIEGADVIALQEIERYWPRSGMVDQVAVLAKRLPDHWVAYGANLDLHSPTAFPGELNGARRQFGNAVFSRHPILSQANIPLPRPTRTDQTMQRGALEVVIDTAVGPVRIYSTHLDYLSPRSRALQLSAIAERNSNSYIGGGGWEGAHAVSDEWLVGDEPSRTWHAILLGDMNIDCGTDEHKSALAVLGFVDAWQVAGDGSAGATKDGLRIDHAWVTSELAQNVRAAWVDERAQGSDHKPAWFEFDL